MIEITDELNLMNGEGDDITDEWNWWVFKEYWYYWWINDEW